MSDTIDSVGKVNTTVVWYRWYNYVYFICNT